MARESSFCFSSVSILSLSAFMFAVNPVLHPEEIGFIDLSQIESQPACVDHVRKPAAASKKVDPLVDCVCGLGVRACSCVLDPARFPSCRCVHFCACVSTFTASHLNIQKREGGNLMLNPISYHTC